MAEMILTESKEVALFFFFFSELWADRGHVVLLIVFCPRIYYYMFSFVYSEH